MILIEKSKFIFNSFVSGDYSAPSSHSYAYARLLNIGLIPQKMPTNSKNMCLSGLGNVAQEICDPLDDRNC